MSMTDPIADFLARIRNGILSRKAAIECPRSNIKLRIAEILQAPRSKVPEWLANYDRHGEEGLLMGECLGRPARLSEA